MVSSVVALDEPQDVGQGVLQGHCSQCHKVWTLKERQGVCQWCLNAASCQSSTSKPRQIKSSRSRSRRQADGNGYDHLTGEWLTYYKVASRFNHKAKAEDTGDLLHDIILTLARAERSNGHRPFTEAVMCRIASRAQADYSDAHAVLSLSPDAYKLSRTAAAFQRAGLEVEVIPLEFATEKNLAESQRLWRQITALR